MVKHQCENPLHNLGISSAHQHIPHKIAMFVQVVLVVVALPGAANTTDFVNCKYFSMHHSSLFIFFNLFYFIFPCAVGYLQFDYSSSFYYCHIHIPAPANDYGNYISFHLNIMYNNLMYLH